VGVCGGGGAAVNMAMNHLIPENDGEHLYKLKNYFLPKDDPDPWNQMELSGRDSWYINSGCYCSGRPRLTCPCFPFSLQANYWLSLQRMQALGLRRFSAWNAFYQQGPCSAHRSLLGFTTVTA